MGALQDVAAHHAVGSVSFAAPATAAFKNQRGFSGLAFVAPNIYNLTLAQGLGADEQVIKVSGRNGFHAEPTRISDTVIRVETTDGSGPAPGAFDIDVLKLVQLGSHITPPADPAGTPFGPALVVTPPVYIVAPAALALPNTYATPSLAQAAAVADGYGGVAPASRALILWLPGTYADNLVAVPGIDHAAWDQTAEGATVLVPVPGSGLPALTFTPPALSDTITTSISWTGIDIVNNTEAADPCVLFDGALGATLRIANATISSAFDAIQPANTFIAGADRALLVLDNVRLVAEAGAAIFQVGAVRHRFSNVTMQRLAAPWVVCQLGGGEGTWRNVVMTGEFVAGAAAGAFSWFDVTCVGLGGLVTMLMDAPCIIRHWSGSHINSVNPTVQGTGHYLAGCVAGPEGIPGPFCTTTTYTSQPKATEMLGAVGVVWVGAAPQDSDEALNRIAAFLATTAAAPIP